MLWQTTVLTLEERRFLEVSRQRRWFQTFRSGTWAGLVIAVFVPPMACAIGSTAMMVRLLPFSACLAGSWIVARLGFERTPSLQIWTGTLVAVVSTVLFGYGNQYGIAAAGILYPDGGLLYMAFAMTLLFFVYPAWRHQAIVALTLFLAALFSVAGIAGATKWLFVYGTSLVFVATIIREVEKMQDGAVLANLRRLAPMAPLAIVEQAVLDEVDIEVAFPVAERFCACISLGWSDYEGLVAQIPPDALVVHLKDYYGAVHAAIQAVGSRDQLYLDATADEIFLVIPATERVSRLEAQDYALGIAEHLVRSAAAATEATVVGGVSFGTAWVGLVGPHTHRKTTALGEVPGRAARLRSLAKKAAQSRGLETRIAIDREDLPEAQAQAGGWRLVTVGAELAVRDVDMTHAYVLESQT